MHNIVEPIWGNVKTAEKELAYAMRLPVKESIYGVRH
jgi:hypothetical protein